jgi:hypothetical protein
MCPGTGAGAERGDAEIAPPQQPVLPHKRLKSGYIGTYRQAKKMVT